MSLILEAQPVPLQEDADGVVRVASTRVTLETVVGAFLEGQSAEEITDQYPSLSLGKVYAVIGYYLGHRAAVDAYVHEREQAACATRLENETRFDPIGVRSRLLSRRGG
ncbi:MAG: DUF433 domain-containing protein [Planctomycetales bacterium]